MLEDLDNFYEKNRFRNWYEGLSQISLSYIEPSSKKKCYLLKTLGKQAVNMEKYEIKDIPKEDQCIRGGDTYQTQLLMQLSI